MPSYIELADMDGSGALDILVAGEDAITLLVTTAWEPMTNYR